MDGVSEENHRFGDYIPKQCLAENDISRSWLAEQASVGRMVLIEELKEEAAGEMEIFLADVRAMAAVEHPLVGSIYEACTDNGSCYYAHELLPGETLEERAAQGERIKPQRFVHILKRVAEANIYYETHGNATSPLGLNAIHLDKQGVIRMKNLAIAGERTPEDSPRDVVKIGDEMEPLLDRDQPGATRCLTLLAWMRGQDVPKPLRWAQVRGYCEQIEQQLTTPSDVIAPPTAAMRPEKRNGFVWVVGILLLAVIAVVMMFPKKTKRTAAKAAKPDFVSVQRGKYTTPEGMNVMVPDFRISAYEVTIGEYAEFLEKLKLLGDEMAFDHPEQPASKSGHLPDDWENLYLAAKTAGVWNGREIDIHTPVVGVDWWDAFAFAKSKRANLPTQEMWLGALMAGAAVPSKIPVSELLPVNAETADRATNGLLGMAGSVSEWTSEPRPNPANPLGEPLWVIVGGSYLKPAKGALSLDWVTDRMLRRPDLGFRICKDKE
jgi:Sulfatase-modifying factor enzyme 1